MPLLSKTALTGTLFISPWPSGPKCLSGEKLARPRCSPKNRDPARWVILLAEPTFCFPRKRLDSFLRKCMESWPNKVARVCGLPSTRKNFSPYNWGLLFLRSFLWVLWVSMIKSLFWKKKNLMTDFSVGFRSPYRCPQRSPTCKQSNI